MTLDKRRLLIAAAVLVAAALAVFLWLRGRGGGGGDEKPAAAKKEAAGPRRAGASDSSSGQLPAASPVAMDNDPAGDLRLEGQVLGPDDEPVGGALVLLGSVPPRTATSEKDGSFEFDKLIGRTYALSARSGDMVGGPVMHTLRASSDPVVIRLAPGASVEVTVVSAGSGAPIAGASVDAGEGPENGGPSATTDSKGLALLKGLAPGSFAVIHARAGGHAPGHALVQVPSAPGARGAARIELKAGAPVSGVVVDESGGPIAGAQVAARDVSLPWDMPDERDLATTDDKGRFTIKAVAAGTYRFAATHKEHAPGSSEPIALDGASEKKDVRIALKAGGVAAGKVVDAGGAPVPWATVRIGSQRGALQMQDAPTRQVIAGEQGTFEVKGLARGALMAIALSETASSQPVVFDLGAARERRDLVLTLDVTGSIAGVVVDGSGEPVPEAQVAAYPDFFAGEVGEDFSLRGPAVDSTDGGGAFTLRGLPVGNYRLFPSRSGLGQNPFARQGTKARTGDVRVKLVLQADGGVKGKVVFEGGGSPGLFTVSTGYVAGVPVANKDGAFELPSIAPGTHDIAIRGPDFAETFVRGVEVASGQVKDLGQVTVKRGRNVSGRVVGPDGRAVAGATVVLGKQLFGDGKSLASAEIKGFEEQMGLRRTTTDGDGRYAMRGIGDKELLIAAEHEAQGRSPASQVPPGKESVTVDLKLAG
ncbi:MAG TPA: carboxypeptidase-like regulatory domain-containing protein, partial [Kofleriaceae bacterium]|nr:carboxypeptidase-like regulatory domain-containing protein [Kofleriaceae bacterium]